jgi:CopG family transcriptional regulator, nickel-responsive regulator
MSNLVRLSLSIDEPLYQRLEQMVAESGYANRSEFFRDLIRSRLVEREWERDTEAVGTVTLLYDHAAHDLSSKLTHLQHHHHKAVLATTHVHLDERLCIEMILVRGHAREIRRLADELGQQKGVLHANLAISSTGLDLA